MSDQDDEGESSGGAPRWAADEPTAMWDDSALEGAGYDQLAKDRAARPRAATGPATEREVRGEDRSAVKVSSELTGAQRLQPAASNEKRSLSWAITIACALALGVAVYLVVRLLR